MKAITLALVVALALTLACSSESESPGESPPIVHGGFEVGTPVTHAGLSLCPVYRRGAGAAPTHGEFVTLPVALERGLVEIREVDAGGQVPSLILDNRSDETVLLSAGDLVKGGKQDRIVTQDVLVAPGREKVSLDVLCVERGRWSTGGRGLSFGFGGRAQGMLKEVAQVETSQQAAWSRVAILNRGYARAGGFTAGMSFDDARTYLWSLETPEVKKLIDPYLTAFRPVLEADPDIVGFVVALGEKPTTLEVYSHPALFAQVREEVLRSFVLDALSSFEGKTPEGGAVEHESMAAFLEDALSASPVEKAPGPISEAWTCRGRECEVHQTRDGGGRLVHLNGYRR